MLDRVKGRELRVVVVLTAAVLAAIAAAVAYAAATYAPNTAVVDLTTRCSGQNAEVEQATDPANGLVYDEWMGCSGIAFARSTDGGKTFSTPLNVPGSVGSAFNAWDPALAVGPDGTVYAAFMTSHSSQWYPVVAASFDHGKTFKQLTKFASSVSDAVTAIVSGGSVAEPKELEGGLIHRRALSSVAEMLFASKATS